jgi:hypothetical protein
MHFAPPIFQQKGRMTMNKEKIKFNTLAWMGLEG